MEETKTLFSQKAIAIATFFGGPAAAGYLIKKNYEAYNQEDNGRKAFILGIISTLLIYAGLFSLPEQIIDKIPNAVIPAVYTAIIYLIVEKIQGPWLKEHEASGGMFYSGWKAAGVGAVFMVILFLMLAGTLYFTGDLFQPEYDSTTYDSEVAKFSKNESQALKVFNEITSDRPQFVIKELRKGIILWKENREIVNRLNAIENLPEELLEFDNKLLTYCNLRIQHYEIIIKALSEDTDMYDSEMERIGEELNKILEALDYE